MRVALGVITAIVITLVVGSVLWISVWPPLTRASGIPANQIRIGRSLGSRKAIQNISLYAAFQDSDYLQFASTTLDKVVQTYVTPGNVNVTVRYFPGSDGTTIGEAHWAAYATECANAQDHFWAFHDKLVSTWNGAHVGTFAREQLLRYAQEMGTFQISQFSQCLITEKYAALVADDLANARDLQVTRTPACVVNGLLAPVDGPSLTELGKYLAVSPQAW